MLAETTEPAMPVASKLLLSILMPLPLLSIATVVSAAEPPAAPVARLTSAECEVWARELSFAQSVADHDAAAFAAHLEPDAAFAAESPQPQRGSGLIASRWAGLIEGRNLLLSWYPSRTTIGGAADVAVSSGPALYEDLRPGANPRYRIGAFHSVWHKGADGVWRILFDDGIDPQPASAAQVSAFREGRKPVCPQG
jgi:ketosteroid isomerase-like protein